MGRSRLGLRLSLVLVGVTAAGTLITAVYVARILERRVIESLEAGLVRSARLVHETLVARGGQPGLPRDIQALTARYGQALGVRVTVIGVDGTVLGDSAPEAEILGELENHAARPEVRAALAGGIGRDVRRSHTPEVEMLYVAIPLEGPSRPRGAIRLALPMTEVANALAPVRRTALTGAVLGLLVAVAIGVFLSRRVTEPVARMRAAAQRMAGGEFGQRVPISGSGEIAELGHVLNRMAAALQEKVETLEAERAEVAAILEGMVEGVIALDERGRILLVNPGAREILGLGEMPVEHRTLLEVIRHKTLWDLVETCRAGAPREQCQAELDLGPPLARILQAQATRVPFARQGSGVVLVLHDVTALRRLERVRAHFVENVSHELRTPLTAIQGYLETLLEGALADPAHAGRFVEIAHAHAVRLGRLVDDLLQLSDVETGRAVLDLQPVDLHAVAATVAGTFEQQATQKGVSLLNDVPAGLRVRADRDRLVQILVNLVDNAVKYTPRGGRVMLGADGRGTNRVEITVADTGIGIPSTALPRLTERFYRVDKARSRTLGGTGLGLAIVKHLVQAHGGELRIDSELGRGTTVRITLPAPGADAS